MNADLMTAAEVAGKLRLSRRHVHRLVESGELPEAGQLPGKTGARLFRRSDVEAVAIARSHKQAATIGAHANDGHVVITADDLGAVVEHHNGAVASC